MDWEGAEISYCYNMGNINTVGCWTGGISGDVTRGAKIKNCYNKGTIVTEQERVEGDYIGGIVGNSYTDVEKISEVSNCYNLGSIMSNNSRTDQRSSNRRYSGINTEWICKN